MVESKDADTAEDLELLLENVHKEVTGNEFRLCVDKRCSHVVERLVERSSALHVRSLLTRMVAGGWIFALCTSPSGSRVVESILRRCPAVLAAEHAAPGAVETPPPPLTELFASFCGELKSHWVDLACDRFGSHIVRTLIALLTGRDISAKDAHKKRRGGPAALADEAESSMANKPHLLQYAKVLNTMLKRFIALDLGTVRELAVDAHAGPVVQELLAVMRRHAKQKHADRFIDRLLSHDEEVRGGEVTIH
jgi:nucleolar protein 9